MGLFAGLSNLLGVGAGIYGGLRQDQNARWSNDFLINLLNRQDGAYNFGRDQWGNLLNQAQGAILPGQTGAQGNLFGDGSTGANYSFLLNNLLNTPENSQYSAQRIMQDYGGPFGTTNSGRAQGDLFNLGSDGSRAAGIADLASSGFANGGWTPQRQEILDNLGPLMQGMTPAQQQTLMSGLGLMQNNGSTARNDGIMDRGAEAIQFGGSTPWLEGLIENVGGIAQNQGQTAGTQGVQNAAMNLLQTGGTNPFLNAGSSVGLQGLGTGGRTGVTEGLASRGLDLFNRESLLTPEQAMSFAADTSGTATQQAYEAIQRRAQARGGGPGAVVAAGNATGAMADFADDAARNKAEAIRNALLGQQTLGLQQAGMGANAAEAAQGAENSRLGVFGSLLGNTQGTAAQNLSTGFGALNNAQELETQRYLQALGLVPAAQGQATSRAGTIGGLGLQADQNNTGRMNLGGNLLQNFTGSQQNGVNAMNQFTGQQDQYQQMLAQLGLSGTNTQAGIMQNFYGNELASANQGNQRANLFGNLVNNQFGNIQGNLNQNSGLLQGSWSPLTGLAQQGQNWGITGLNNLNLGSFNGGQAQTGLAGQLSGALRRP